MIREWPGCLPRLVRTHQQQENGRALRAEKIRRCATASETTTCTSPAPVYDVEVGLANAGLCWFWRAQLGALARVLHEISRQARSERQSSRSQLRWICVVLEGRRGNQLTFHPLRPQQQGATGRSLNIPAKLCRGPFRSPFSRTAAAVVLRCPAGRSS